MDWKKVLQPGVNIKRWLILLLIGMTLTGLGIAHVLQNLTPDQTEGSLLWYLGLKFVAEPARTVIFLVAGVLISVGSFVQLNRHLLNALLPHGLSGGRLAVVYDREMANKPNVVIFGSGIGLLIFLNSLRDMVAGITVVLPMGEDTQLYRELLNANQLGLLRNVFVSTIPNATICAEFSDGHVLEGFLAIKDSKRFGFINRLFAKYRDDKPQMTVPENADIIKAIEAADAIIFGPASLFVGIIPSLLAQDVAAAVGQSRAAKIFVCNIMTEPGKTDGFSVTKHVSMLEQHGGFYLDYIILNKNRVAFDLAKKYHDSGADQVLLDFDEFENSHIKVNLADRSGEVRMLNRAVLIEEDLISAAVQRVLEGGTNPRYEADSKLVVRHDSEKMRAVFHRVFDLMAQRPRTSA
ncbi:MAG: 2-phospho-L-lactate transferase CofD family protein [Anaerolineae bacterium]